MKNFGLYIIITKPVLPYSKIAEICVNNEVEMIQLREKHLNDKEIVKIGRELKSIVKGSKTKLVINDRPDIAVLCDADCLHIGQDDLSYEDALKIVGNDMLIGLSTHSVQQAKDALKKEPYYIGFGPVYTTTAKAIPDPVVGTDQLKEVLSFANVPVVAIGGVFPENIEAVLKTGVNNIAMVRYFMQAEDIDKKIKKIKILINKYSHDTITTST